MKNTAVLLLLFLSFCAFNACTTTSSSPSNEEDEMETNIGYASNETEATDGNIDKNSDEIAMESPDNEASPTISNSINVHHSNVRTEEDTVAIQSYSTAADLMPEETPKSIEDYQPNERGIYDISWLTLTDVKFEEKIAAQDSALYLFPNFGKIVRSLEGKKVAIKGFVIPIDPTEHYYVLSANPYSACFFCGKAGPESIMELFLKKAPTEPYELDQFVAFEGVFKLNGTDVEHCNYIMEQAVLVK